MVDENRHLCPVKQKPLNKQRSHEFNYRTVFKDGVWVFQERLLSNALEWKDW